MYSGPLGAQYTPTTEQSLQPQVFCFILFCFNSLSLAEVVAQWKRG